MKYKFKDESGVHEVEVKRNSDTITLEMNGERTELASTHRPPALYLLSNNGEALRGYAVRVKDRVFVHLAGRSWTFQDVTDEREGVAGGEAGDSKVVAPMPGSVIKLLVGAGDAVKRDQPLIIVEAMKMENEVRSTLDGTVDKILVAPGQQVGFGEVLIELAPLEASDA